MQLVYVNVDETNMFGEPIGDAGGSTMIYAGTGHRLEVLRWDDAVDLEAVHQKTVRFATEILPKYNPTKVISGMAIGWDTALAIAALEMGIPLIAAVPFEGQDAIWPKHAQERYRAILDRCAEVHIVCPGGYATHKYHIRDRWMCDHAEGVIALWNGQKFGGTYSTIKYAKSISLEIFNVWPGWATFDVVAHEQLYARIEELEETLFEDLDYRPDC